MNPIKKIREDYNLTQADLARLADVNISIVSRVENGTFANVPPSITRALSGLAHDWDDRSTPVGLLRDYTNWINKELLKVHLPNPIIDPTVETTPEQFAVWRSVACKLNGIKDTAISFAGLLKINIYVVDKWEKGTMKQIPEQILARIQYIRDNQTRKPQ